MPVKCEKCGSNVSAFDAETFKNVVICTKCASAAKSEGGNQALHRATLGLHGILDDASPGSQAARMAVLAGVLSFALAVSAFLPLGSASVHLTLLIAAVMACLLTPAWAAICSGLLLLLTYASPILPVGVTQFRSGGGGVLTSGLIALGMLISIPIGASIRAAMKRARPKSLGSIAAATTVFVFTRMTGAAYLSWAAKAGFGQALAMTLTNYVLFELAEIVAAVVIALALGRMLKLDVNKTAVEPDAVQQ